jgi:hypothetical protein
VERIKLICLDIDGVLNNSSQGMTHRTFCLHEDKIKLLNRIIMETNTDKIPTKILLTSTYRLDFVSSSGVNMWFESVGIFPVVIGITEHFHSRRGYEILSWLVNAKFNNHIHIHSLCILDDDNDMEIMEPWLINTINKIGLTELEAKKAIAMLNGSRFNLNVALGYKDGDFKN